jgi:hypothetical protein
MGMDVCLNLVEKRSGLKDLFLFICGKNLKYVFDRNPPTWGGDQESG